ncbi:hypothetical protein JCM14469_12790 [Desulfatiferula olefinivorans]
MKTAFAYWDNRIAPVFDTARQIHIVESEGRRVVRESHSPLPDESPWAKVGKLAELGVDTLVCGAISRSLAELVEANGIAIVSFVTGSLDAVIGASLRGGLRRKMFAMPGCPDRGRRTRGGHPFRQTSEKAVGRRQGRGRPPASGPSGRCVCPTCGHTETHIPGMPCVERTCPACKAVMRRQ